MMMGNLGGYREFGGAEGHATSRKVDVKNGLRNVADYLLRERGRKEGK